MLILAIEPDRRQAAQLSSVVFPRLKAEAVIAPSAERAFAALGDRVPDLILTPALLSPKDETALVDRLRALDGAASYVQTLTIPVLAAPSQKKSRRGVLSKLRRQEGRATPEGCDPAVFAEQCVTYLERAKSERAILEPDTFEEPDIVIEAPPVVAQPVHEEPLAAQAVVEDSVVEEPVFDEILTVLAEPVLAEPVFAEPVLAEPVFAEPVFQEAVVEEPIVAELVPETMALEAAALEDVWTPLPVDSSRFWPPVEGEPAESRAVILTMEQPAAPEPEPVVPAAPEPVVLTAPGPVVPAAPEAVVPATEKRPGVKRQARKPIQDEWGLFDPDQCGFAALLRKLEEITNVA